MTKRNRDALGILVFVLSIATSAHAQTVTLTDTANAAIADDSCFETIGFGDGGIRRHFLINSAGLLTDVNVILRINHGFRGDLQVGLRYETFDYSTTSATIALIDNHGSTADNYYATIDSAAATSCLEACNPSATGCGGLPGVTCRPDGSLVLLNGLPARGEFILFVCDNAPEDVGTLVEWSLVITGMSDQRDVDGNGEITALTDGLLTLRYDFGFRGATLTNNAVGPNCTRCSAPQIEAFLGFEYPD